MIISEKKTLIIAEMNKEIDISLSLTEEEFREFQKRGYFRGVKYRWSKQSGEYTVYISPSSYDKFTQNMEATGKEFK